MIERYDTLDEVTPHEENIRVFSESNAYQGESWQRIIKDIKERIVGNELTLQEHYDGLERLDDFKVLLPNSIWLIHHRCLIGDKEHEGLQTLLQLPIIPNSSALVCCIDSTASDQLALVNTVEERYDGIVPVTSCPELVGVVSMYLNTANPYNGQAGKQYIKTWNNLVHDQLENYG